jgi:hypothetical protein
MARNQIHLAFNPDTMTVSDLKAAAGTLRNLLQRLEMMQQSTDDENVIAEDCYLQMLQIADRYDTDPQ